MSTLQTMNLILSVPCAGIALVLACVMISGAISDRKDRLTSSHVPEPRA